MKKWIIPFLLLIPPLYAQWEWSDPITVSRGVAPDLDIDRKTGRLHIVSMNNGAVYTLMDSLGAIRDQEIVPGSEYDYGGWVFGAAVATDMNGNPHVCYRLPNAFQFDLYYRSKTASGWQTPLTLFTNVYRGYMVRLDVDGSNWVHIVNTRPNSDIEGQIEYTRIVDGQVDKKLSWYQDYNAHLRLEIEATAASFVHVIAGCPKTPNGSINYYRSEDGGFTLQPMGDVRSGDCTGRNESPDIFADQIGNVHICYGTQQDASKGGKPSIRYVRYREKQRVRDVAVTQAGSLAAWMGGQGWGICSIAASDSGDAVMIAYMQKDMGKLYTILSADGGETWNDPVMMSANAEARPDGRPRPILRAYRNHFYLLYSETSDTLVEDTRKCHVVLRHLRNVGDLPPQAVANGPYQGSEGIPIVLDASASFDRGKYAKVVEYDWDIDNDGQYELTTELPKIQYAFPDDYQGPIVLRIQDVIGQIDTSRTTAKIVNVPPKAEAGPDKTCKEGEQAVFTAEVSDVALDTLTCVWSFGDNQIGTGQTSNHAYRDEGSFKVLLFVMDEDGGQSRDSLRVTVLNADPTADAWGPYMCPLSEAVRFKGSATDPGVGDVLSYNWDLDGDGIFETSGQNPRKQYTALGKTLVRLRVTDEDGGVGTDTASVRIVLDNPIVGVIPNQTIQEGGTFTPIPLDDHVEDPFYADANLVWTYRGNMDLKISLNGHVFSAAVPDSEWAGSETVALIATNPKNFSDSTFVTFQVNSVNDRPQWVRPVPDFAFDEDSSLAVPLDSLRTRVKDIDNPASEWTFSFTGSQHVKGTVDAGSDVLVLSATVNWNGTETVTFSVADKGGLIASTQSRVTVRSIPDQPSPFILVYPMVYTKSAWPDTIRFRWYRTVDNDTVNGLVYYAWELVDQGDIHTPVASNAVFDTTFVYTTDKTLPNGVYYWSVVGYTSKGASVKSGNVGMLLIGMTGVDEPPTTAAIPEAFQLLQNYPNPFNPETRIVYHLPKASRVRLSVCNPLGMEVRVLENGMKPVGVHTVTWDGRDAGGRKLPSGVYLCRFQSESVSFFKKMMLMQ